MNAFTPTAEQLNAQSLFDTGNDLKIEAGAGTGKTSTLQLLANSTTRRGQYLAFNKSIVDEAKTKFGDNVACNTAHSLAYRAVGKDYARRIQSSQRMKSWDIAAVLGLDPVNVVTFADEKKQLSPSFLAGLAMRAIERFCTTADPKPTYRHVPRVEGLDNPSWGPGIQRYPVNDMVAKAIEPALAVAWADLRKLNGALPFKHSHYLKMWQLSKPRIEADFILFDEAQDANPVMVAVIAAQTHAQLVWVGDSQQQIYTFTGAVNALQNIPAEQTAYLTQSFRFGQAIADVANEILEALTAPLRLSGFDKILSVVDGVDEPVAILTRTNAAAVRTVMSYVKDGKKPHLVGGGGEIASFARAAEKLMDGRRVEHPELACFSTWGEVIEYVANDEQGGDLRLMVSLIDEFGVATILEALGQTHSSETGCDVVVSTAHKAKGREWASVRLASDFPDAPKGEELRLYYVAVTRAKYELDITGCGYLNPAQQGEVAAGAGAGSAAAPGAGAVPALDGRQDEAGVRADRSNNSSQAAA